jgi:hypothetical protein
MGYHSRCHSEYRPCESKRSSLPVSTPGTPGTPGTPSAHSADGARVLTPALRCRAARSPAAANGTGPAVDAAPGMPPAHVGTPSTVTGTVPRGISIGISFNVGARLGLGMRCLSG